MEELYQVTSALKHLTFGKHIALITDARFSGVSTGACIGHVTPEALAGGPVGKILEGDLIEIFVDRNTLEGEVNLVGENGREFTAEEGTRILADRPMRPGLSSRSSPARRYASLGRAPKRERRYLGRLCLRRRIDFERTKMIPPSLELEGRYVRLEPLRPLHTAALSAALCNPDTYHLWDYLFDGPYEDEGSFAESIERKAASRDPFFLAIVDPGTQAAIGYASFMRIEPNHRVIEVGSILYTPALQHTTAATDAMYVMARYVFEELQYRRYEWKCNALNAPSRRAAIRLGFTFEGVFRQHMMVKGRNRDTAWFSMLDGEWPERKIEFERWLHPSNFDSDGNQLTRLSQK